MRNEFSDLSNVVLEYFFMNLNNLDDLQPKAVINIDNCTFQEDILKYPKIWPSDTAFNKKVNLTKFINSLKFSGKNISVINGVKSSLVYLKISEYHPNIVIIKDSLINQINVLCVEKTKSRTLCIVLIDSNVRQILDDFTKNNHNIYLFIFGGYVGQIDIDNNHLFTSSTYGTTLKSYCIDEIRFELNFGEALSRKNSKSYTENRKNDFLYIRTDEKNKYIDFSKIQLDEVGDDTSTQLETQVTYVETRLTSKRLYLQIFNKLSSILTQISDQELKERRCINELLKLLNIYSNILNGKRSNRQAKKSLDELLDWKINLKFDANDDFIKLSSLFVTSKISRILNCCRTKVLYELCNGDNYCEDQGRLINQLVRQSIIEMHSYPIIFVLKTLVAILIPFLKIEPDYKIIDTLTSFAKYEKICDYVRFSKCISDIKKLVYKNCFWTQNLLERRELCF